jgi:hypothetical protein
MNNLIGILSQKSYDTLGSEEMEKLIVLGYGVIPLMKNRRGSVELDHKKWKDSNPGSASIKPHDLSQIPRIPIADSLVADEYGGASKHRHCKSLNKSGGIVSSSSSVPSVAEERDTISICASTNANILTPSNISRVINNIGSFNCGGKIVAGAG